MRGAVLAVVLGLASVCARAQGVTAPVARYPVQVFALRVEGQDLRMAYRDVAPTGAANGKTVVLLHGKNFSGFYWEQTIAALTAQGYRVIAPDQLGFGMSSRPEIHYSFHQMAENTKALLDKLMVKHMVVVGHSMGGMLAVRMALMYPGMVDRLVLEDPIGLEDYRVLVPYVSLEDEYKTEMAQTYAKMLAYQKTYYPGAWKPEYEAYARDQASILGSPEYPRAAMAAALTYEMIYEQPVVYELGRIKQPTLIVIGLDDRTVVGKGLLPPELVNVAGQYPELGKKTQAAIAGSELVEIKDCGHIPHIQKPEEFLRALSGFLAK